MALVSDKLSSQFDSEQITSDEIWSKLVGALGKPAALWLYAIKKLSQ